jgi:hypothetical protein
MDLFGELHVPAPLASDIETANNMRLACPQNLSWTTRKEINLPVTGTEPGGYYFHFIINVGKNGTKIEDPMRKYRCLLCACLENISLSINHSGKYFESSCKEE